MQWDRRTVVAVLVVAAVLPFVGTLAFEFTYDDHWTIESNPWLERPFATTFGAIVEGQGARLRIPDPSRPVMVLSNALDRRLFGLRPLYHHAHSVALHAVASLLASALAFVVLKHRRAAIYAGCLFAVAPIHTEVVASIHYREDLLATIGLFGFLITFLLPTNHPHSVGRAMLTSGWLAFGLLAKESAVVAVLATPLLVWLVFPAGERRDALARRERSLVGALVVLVLYGSWRAGLTIHGDGVARAAPLELGDALARSARALLIGLYDSTIPRLPIPIDAPMRRASAGYFAAIGALGALVVGLARTPRTRPYAVGLTLALVLPLASTPITGAANERADRFLYAAALGPAIGLAHWMARGGLKRIVADRIVIALTIALGVFTFRAARVFRSDLTLFQAAVQAAPDSARAHTALAYALRVRGDLDGADAELARALALDPLYARARLGLAMTLLVRGDGAAANAVLDQLEARGQRIEGFDGARRCASMPRAPARRCANGDSD